MTIVHLCFVVASNFVKYNVGRSLAIALHLKWSEFLVAMETGDEDLVEGEAVKTKDPPSAGHEADNLQDSSSQGHPSNPLKSQQLFSTRATGDSILPTS